MKRDRISSMVIGFLAASSALSTGCGGDDFRSTGSTSGATGGTGGETAGPGGSGGDGDAGGGSGTGGSVSGSGGEGGETACEPGALADCYEGADGTAGVGACVHGVETCTKDGTPGACMGQVLPAEEDCSNALDDDCDGEINDGCPCTPGEATSCYSGPAGTADVGICKSGMQTCNPDGMGYGPCTGEVPPAVEDCGSPLDEDCSGVACSQALWSKIAGDVSQQAAYAVAVDASGSVYEVGSFSGTIDLGGGPLISGGGNDAFVAKYDAAGVHQWSQKLGASDEQLATDVAVDPMGNLIVAGYYKGSITLGAGTLTSPSGYSAWLAKLDAAGNVLWSASSSIGPTYASPHVAADKDGNVILAFSADHTVCFNCSANGLDIKLKKLSPTGTAMIDKWFTCDSNQYLNDVATDPAGNIVLAGSHDGSVSFGNGTLTGAGGKDIFVAKLDPSGNQAWQKAYGGALDQVAQSIAVNALGEILVGGYFNGQTNFAPGILTSAGSADAFLMKISAGGATTWAKQFGNASLQSVYGVAFDAAGNIAVAGTFDGTIAFGGPALASQGGGDAFLAKLNPTGAHVWSKAFGDALMQVGMAVATSASGDVVLGGFADGTMDFGTGALASPGGGDAIIAKFAP